MNPRSLVVTLVAAFVTIAATDYLIHGLWLDGAYKATASLWRPEAEMKSHIPWMLLAQLLVATAFTLIFAACVAEKRSMSWTLKFAICMGLFAGAGQIMMFAVQPLPRKLVRHWFLAGVAQAVVLGVVVHAVYKPETLAPRK